MIQATVVTKEIDPQGPGLVEEIFAWFEARHDRVARIVCGGAKHLKVLQHHDCFEATLPDDHPHEEAGGVSKGVIFGARVYRSKQLEPNVIQAEGQALTDTSAPVNTCIFVERR